MFDFTVPNLLLAAFLLPLAGFIVEIFAPKWQRDRKDKTPALVAVACIGLAFVLSTTAFVKWGVDSHWAAFASSEHHDEHGEGHDGDAKHHEKEHDEHGEKKDEEEHAEVTHYVGVWYTLASFGDGLEINIEYYIDSLTLSMFVMVTLIATCIHVFAMGYMSDELTDDHVDHEVHTSSGGHFHRPGRFYRFFAYLSLFSFSMLGIVISGSIFQVFVFWELVGVSSYLLIGFYVERKSASTAANKAFIMNRVGDFGFLIGLMIVWSYFGTFTFGDVPAGEDAHAKPGLFTMANGDHGHLHFHETEAGETEVKIQDEKGHTIPYWLFVLAGLGIFGGCIGKSAQFPLQTWLPDAMEGPTPVSALVHSATMVAAGVYLTARFSPLFAPEVLLIIAYVGCVTLFLGATIAIVATDIKRVLAYSTISQLGYMMLALGLAGWGAGLYHLFTHAFFKSLMFLCSGSVIAGCHHVQEMPRMGGLLKKMPITGYCMLIGVIAICGLAIPIPGFPIAFSGFYSKDAIIATALAYWKLNPVHILLFVVPLITAGITAFYMFRLWFYTFWGEPRDKELYDHVHESPWVMTAPLIVLSVFAIICAHPGESGPLYQSIVGSEPAAFAHAQMDVGVTGTSISLPGHHEVHEVHSQAGVLALITAIGGALLAFFVYGIRVVNPADIKKQFSGLHQFLTDKWQFDELYDAAFTKPSVVVGGWMAAIDRNVLDRFLHWLAATAVKIAQWDRWFDERAVDGLVNLVGDKTRVTGHKLRTIQTGSLRQYVLLILVAVGVLAVIVPIFAILG